MKKPLNIAELGIIGLVIFLVFLTFLYFNERSREVGNAILTAIIVLGIEVFLYGLRSFQVRIRQMRKRTVRSLNSTGTVKRRRSKS